MRLVDATCAEESIYGPSFADEFEQGVQLGMVKGIEAVEVWNQLGVCRILEIQTGAVFVYLKAVCLNLFCLFTKKR